MCRPRKWLRLTSLLPVTALPKRSLFRTNWGRSYLLRSTIRMWTLASGFRTRGKRSTGNLDRPRSGRTQPQTCSQAPTRWPCPTAPWARIPSPPRTLRTSAARLLWREAAAGATNHILSGRSASCKHCSKRSSLSRLKRTQSLKSATRPTNKWSRFASRFARVKSRPSPTLPAACRRHRT